MFCFDCHAGKQGGSKAAADKTTASQPRSERPAKQPRVAAANGTATTTASAKDTAKSQQQQQPPPPHTASPAKPHQPSAMELAAAASPWDPNSSLPTTIQQPTQGSPHLTLPKAGAAPTLSNNANKGSAGASTSKAAAAATPIRPTPTTTPAKPSSQAAAAAESSSEEDTSSEEESSSDDEDDGTDKPSGSAAAKPAGRAAATAPTKAAAAAASSSSESEDSDSDESDSDSDDEDDAGIAGGDKAGKGTPAAAGQQHRAHTTPPATIPQALPGPPPGGPNNRPLHQTGPPKGVATVIGKGPRSSSAHHSAPSPDANSAQAHHQSRQQQQQQQRQDGAGGGSSSYQAHGHDYGTQYNTVTPVRMGWPPAPRAAHPSTLPKVAADSLRSGDVVAYQLLEIAANFCPQVRVCVCVYLGWDEAVEEAVEACVCWWASSEGLGTWSFIAPSG